MGATTASYKVLSGSAPRRLRAWEIPDRPATLTGNPALLVLVTITDNNTGAVWTNVTDDVFGFYTVDLNTQPLNWNASDTIYVYATDGTYEGSNEGIALGPGNEAYLWLNIAMNSPVGIPEFPMVIMPVIGIVAIAAVVSLKRRRGEL